MIRILLAVGLLFLTAANAVYAQEEEAVQVFRLAAPSIVSLESVASHGTGVILDTAGTILTNAHVVALPLPFKCVVETQRQGEKEAVVYKKVKVLGVHPQLDLALVQIDPDEHPVKLAPATINQNKPETGQRVYAIGNPGAQAGIELSKTITSGLLSGVDRSIEGVKYHQISAAVNPGNSGGPLVDRAGKVIGLVTLKLSDLENVAFAIPLHDFRRNEFRPLADRPRNPEKAEELLKLGNKLIGDLNSLDKRRQGKSEQAEFLRLLAIQVFHEALLQDPGNASIYSVLGELLSNLDEHEAAEAYFLQALEVDPWYLDARIYRAYGLMKIRQKKPREAEIIWLEGLAKHPLQARALWEDLAILYRDQADLSRAVAYAMGVLMLKAPGTRPEVAQQILTKAGASVKDAQERDRMQALILEAPHDLTRRILRRHAFLREKRTVLTPAFAEFISSKQRQLSDARINQRATFPLPNVEKRLTDVLQSVDPASDALEGTWTEKSGAVESPTTGFAKLAKSADAPESYDLILEVERRGDSGELALGFVHQGKPVVLIVDHGGTRTGLARVATGLHTQPVLPQGESITLTVRVAPSTIKVLSGNRVIYEHKPEGTLPEPPKTWTTPMERPWLLGSNGASFTVHGWWLLPPEPNAGIPVIPTTPNPPLVASSPSPAPPPPSSTPMPGGAGPDGGAWRETQRFGDLGWNVNSLAFSPDGRFIAAGKLDETVLLFDLKKQRQMFNSGRIRDTGQITRVAFSPRGTHLLAASYKGKISVWKMADDGRLSEAKAFAGHSQEILALRVSPDGKLVLSGGRDQRVRGWDLETAREQFLIDGFKNSVTAVGFDQEGDEASATDGAVLVRISTKTGEQIRSTPMNRPVYGRMTLSRDGTLLAAVDGSKLRVWDTKSGSEFPQFDLPVRGVGGGCEVSPDGKSLFVGQAGQLDIYDRESRQLLYSTPLMQKVLNAEVLAISDDGRQVAAIPASAGQTLQVFEAAAASR